MTDTISALREMVATQGVSVLDDPRRCRNLLNDLCPGATRDVNILVAALEEGVPEMLRTSEGSRPDVVSDRLTRSLQDRRGLSAEAAGWAVASWAEALGIEGVTIAETVKKPAPSEQTHHVEQPDPLPSTPWWRRRAVLIPLGVVVLVGLAAGVATLLLRHPNKYPNSTERSLLAHVPSDIRRTCSRSSYRPGDGTRAGVICTSNAGSVFYFLHRNRAALDSYYAEQMRDVHADSNAGNCDAGQLPGDNSWHTKDGATRGRILCSMGTDGVEIAWTYQDLLISGDLVTHSKGYSEAFTAWGGLGPV